MRREPQRPTILPAKCAVACATTDEQFRKIEAMRSLHPEIPDGMPGDTGGFWMSVVIRMSQNFLEQKVPALGLVPLKIGMSGASLGMGLEECKELSRRTNVARLMSAAAEYTNDPNETVLQNPAVIMGFEFAEACGSITDCVSLASGKSWGRKILSIDPLEKPVCDAVRVSYYLKPTSHMRMRWNWRDGMRPLLKEHSGLVGDAVRMGKRKFLDWIGEEGVKAIRTSLSLEPEEFWIRANHGERFGPDGWDKFAEQVRERRRGMRLDLGVGELIQIQGAVESAERLRKEFPGTDSGMNLISQRGSVSHQSGLFGQTESEVVEEYACQR